MLERLARAERALTALHTGQDGSVRVGAFATANISLPPTAPRAFTQARPEAETVVVEGGSSTLMRHLTQRTPDLAVVSDYPSGLKPADGVTTTVLLTDELLVALRRGHPLTDTGRLRQLRDEVWLQSTPASDQPHDARRRLGPRGLPPERTIRIPEWAGSSATPPPAWASLRSRRSPPGRTCTRRTRPVPDRRPAPHRTVHAPLPSNPLPAETALQDLLRDAADATRSSPPARP
ncbi:LysR substrate-binding domain-containing protein [Streptomyces flavidovirens]|uniref:LysR substrate-binding domain-containing protein n=1 Tax=Streptomyces flavidovirens TaxID=67298 RepID=UPI0036A1F22E